MLATKSIPIATHGLLVVSILLAACSGPQQETVALEIRPLEESKAHKIIASVLNDRGYEATGGGEIELSTGIVFECDFKVDGHKMVVEYLTDQDRTSLGTLPPMAPGSRLHVVPAKVVPSTRQNRESPCTST